MNTKNKIVGALMLVVFAVPGISSAQTMSVAQLQAEIASLTSQLNQLEAQLAAAGGTTAWCYTFNNNLSIGMSGTAVSALQNALQKDGESVTASGSFDDQTAAAVTSFQEKYADTILAPNGLSNGTGYAGGATRSKLNGLFGCRAPYPQPIPVPTPAMGAPTIVSISPDSGPGGTQVTIKGNHFTATGNTVMGEPGNEIQIPNLVSPDGTTLTFSLNALGLFCPVGLTPCSAAGTYQLEVTNANGTSNSMPFILTSGIQNPIPSPNQVTVIYPQAGQIFANGGTMNIQWTPASGGIAEIDLVSSGGSAGTYAVYSPKVYGYPTNYSGSFTYSIPPYTSQIPAGSYYLKFYNPAPYSGSNQGPGTLIGQSGVFTINAQQSQSVTITSPQAGQSFNVASTMNIQWSPASAGVALMDLVPMNGGGSYQLYGEKVDGDPVNYSGSFLANLTGVPAGMYYLKLYADNQGNQLLGQVGPLTIIASTPTITVLTPNGGTLTSGATYDITYTSSYPANEEPETGVALYQGNTLIGYPVGTWTGTNDFSWKVGQYTLNGVGTPLYAPAGSNYYIQVYMAGGAKGMSNTSFSIVVPDPVINSFSVNSGQQFSLAAYNYNTITFKAQCGNFVAVVQPQNGSSATYPTGSASICNAPQYYSSSSFNESPGIAPQMVNVPLYLYNAQGVGDGNVTYIGNPPGVNNNGSATLTVNVCNTAGKCVQQTSASFPVYAKACLAAGTKITMADGPYETIEDVKVGDIVKSFDGKKMTSSMVAKVIQREDPIITINGALRAAPDEVVYLANGKSKAANRIVIGDQLRGANGEAVVVRTMTQSNVLAKTYDLSLKNGNSFVADGYVVQALNAVE